MEAIIIFYLLTRRKEALVYLEKLSHIKVLIKGDELKEMGITDGREIGKMLDKLLKKKLSGSISNKNDEIEFVKSQTK